MATQQFDTRIAEIKNSVTIPAYFYNIIVPQLGDYYLDYPVDFDVRPVCKCPIHDEDTPSMRYYEETNTFYCFGCRAGGDVIELHRQFTQHSVGTIPSFDESVEFLYKYFIKGLDSTQLTKAVNKQSKNKELSEPAEILRYNKYVSVLEQQILEDTSIKEEAKQTIWKALDEVNLLVSLNKINAIDGSNYIKEIVKKSII